ncbi:MAG: hypothetical protein EPN84_06365 [Legionella sp.]|nr:MAG: hypothetical protein EPN84_06365 [Legionella sp.]
MPNIFELLEIDPTDNFEIVKEKFRLKNDEFQKQRPIHQSCDLLDRHSELCQTYDQYIHSRNVSIFIHVPYDENPTKKIRNRQTGLFEKRYLSSSDPLIYGLNKLPKDKTLPEVQKEFIETFDYIALAKYLNRRSSQGDFQVGLTQQEAVDIVNQHSHYYYELIVQVTVPLKCLSEHRQLDQWTCKPTFFCLNQRTLINPSDIKMIRPMFGQEYQNSSRMHEIGRLLPFYLWPQNLAAVHNPNYVVKPNPEVDHTHATILRWSI